MSTTSLTRIDVRGVCCPLPLIQLAKAVKGLSAGAVLEITGNDPIFESSVRDYCQVNGHTVLETHAESGQGVRIKIQLGGTNVNG